MPADKHSKTQPAKGQRLSFALRFRTTRLGAGFPPPGGEGTMNRKAIRDWIRGQQLKNRRWKVDPPITLEESRQQQRRNRKPQTARSHG